MNILSFLDLQDQPLHVRRHASAGERLDTASQIIVPVDSVVAVQVTRGGKSLYAGSAGHGEFLGLIPASEGFTIRNIALRDGDYLALSRDRVTELCRERCALNELIAAHTLQAYAHALKQALRHHSLPLESRLAGLLVDAFVKSRCCEVRASHDLLSSILGSRRAGVTIAVHALESAKAIRAYRSRIILRDSAALRRAYQPDISLPRNDLAIGSLTSPIRKGPALQTLI